MRQMALTPRTALTTLALLCATTVVILLTGASLSETADAVTLVLAPFALVSLLLAAVQLGRSATATRAATAAVNRAARSYETFRLLALIADANRIATALDVASDPARADAARMREALLEWNRVGGELRGLLDGRAGVDTALLTDMTETFGLATTAKERLFRAGNDPTAVAQAVRAKIADTTAALGVLAGTLQTTITTEDQA